MTGLLTGGLAGLGSGLLTGGLFDLIAAESIETATPSDLRLGARVRGSAITDIADRLQWNLTPECLATVGLDPVIPGEFITYRHQVVDIAGDAVSLEGATLVMSLYKLDSLALADRIFRRRSLDAIADWAPTTLELAIDSDQATEDEIAGTGTGWWTMTFAPPDETLLKGVIGSWWYDVRALFSDSKVRTLLRGRLQILWPRSVVADFTP